jgi:LEA14-like dessication related protein
LSGKNKRRASLFVLFVLILASGVGAAAKKNISISLSKKEIRDMDSSGLTLVFYLKISNSSPSPYYLTQYDYRVVVNGTDYFSLKTPLDEPILMEKNGDTLISLPVKITYALLFETVKGIEGNTKVTCYVTGLMTFSDGKRKVEKTPFAFLGEFPNFKDLAIEIHPLEVKNLTVGGVDFVFSFSCRNKNNFEVVLGNVAYQLALAGKKISEGVIPGENRIEAQGGKEFSLPLILDFFEVGKELYAVFDQPSSDCQFSGEAPASSVWGNFKLIFSKNEKINISRE